MLSAVGIHRAAVRPQVHKATVESTVEEEWHDCPSEIIPADDGSFAPPAAIELGEVYATPGELAEMQRALERETSRPVNLALALAVLQRIHDRTRPRLDGRPLTLQQKARHVTAADVHDFMLAAGLAGHDISRSVVRQALAAAFASFSTLPAAFFGTGMSSLIHAIFPAGDTIRLVGFLLNVAVLAASPYIHAALLQVFGTQADILRTGHYVPRAGGRKGGNTPTKPQITGELNACILEFKAAYADIGDARRLDLAHAALQAFMPCVHARQLAEARIYIENHHQQFARYPKLVLAPLGQLLRAARWISAWASAAFQMGASLGTSGFQAGMAALDDRAGQLFALRCAMLEDPPLTDAGLARRDAGQRLRPGDVDPAKLRRCFVGPAEARVRLVAQCLRVRQGRSSDLERLEAHRLEGLALDGVAARLLRPGRWHDPLLWAEVAERFHRRGEMSTQFCKYLGQQWQLLVGPGYYVLLPKLLSVAARGRPALPGMVACVALAALFGVAGCRAHPEVAIERNEMLVRIDAAGAGPGFVEFLRNAGIALVALPRQSIQRYAFDRAVEAALDCIEQYRHRKLLQSPRRR